MFIKKIKLLLVGVILIFISALFAEEITVYNITPNILLPWIIYICIIFENRFALTTTFFYGLANDLLNPQLLGFTTILYLLFAQFISLNHNSFNKDKFSTILLSLLIINFLFYIAQWVYFAFSSPEPVYLLYKALITIFYNTILSMIIIFAVYIVDKLQLSLGEI